MKIVLTLIIGAGVGFVAAHFAARTPQGKQFFDGIDSKAREFTGAVVDGYKQREAELRAAISDAEAIVADLASRD